MMTSDRVFVWVWLPGQTSPVVAGSLERRGGGLISFTYGRSYRERLGAIPLYEPELPLRSGTIDPEAGLSIAGCISDAAPDAWGKRVILRNRVGRGAMDTAELDTLTYLLESGSDRIGALDFQESPTTYIPRISHSTLQELEHAAWLYQEGVPLSPQLDLALLRAGSIGGARPKATLTDGDRHLIAKFSAPNDPYPIVKAEYVATALARLAGIDASQVSFTRVLDRDVLLVERFDRTADGGRRILVSALTMFGLDEMFARYASYSELADIIRRRFVEPSATLRELFSRITFNILIGNDDDHARNHAAFWDGASLSLTPAYDLSPRRGSGFTKQLMGIGYPTKALAGDGWRDSQLAGCIERSNIYHLSENEAREICQHQIETIRRNWNTVCDQGQLTRADREFFWGRQFLNSYALEGLES
jgi:serine/threonine-protein kinase HipA